MPTVTVRYIVDDVDAAIEFYCGQLGFGEDMHPAPSFAILSRGDLRLVLSAPSGQGGGGQAMPDGTIPAPGGWNRFAVEVSDLDDRVAALRAAGVSFRNDVVEGVGGRQVLIEDPAGNPVELFEPTRPEARLGRGDGARYDVRVIGRVESPLADARAAPRQGDEGAPDAWLVFAPDVREAARDLAVGDDVLLLTWLHRADRGVQRVHPRSDPGRPERGVFSTRSPDRPNPIGLHRVQILDVDGDKLLVRGLEALDGTPILDVKPVLDAGTDR